MNSVAKVRRLYLICNILKAKYFFFMTNINNIIEFCVKKTLFSCFVFQNALPLQRF